MPTRATLQSHRRKWAQVHSYHRHQCSQQRQHQPDVQSAQARRHWHSYHPITLRSVLAQASRQDAKQGKEAAEVGVMGLRNGRQLCCRLRNEAAA